MKTFIQFITEDIKTYRSGWRGSRRNEYSEYDSDYYDTKPIKLDNDNKTIAWKNTLVPKTRIVSRLSDILPRTDDMVHRGMSHQEYQNILKHGKIQSNGSGNLGDGQKGLTFFSSSPDSAAVYANTFAMRGKGPSFNKPAYVVSIKKPDSSRINTVDGQGKDEVGITGEIPASDIISVHKGSVVKYDKPDIYVPTNTDRSKYAKSNYLSAKKRGEISGTSSTAWLHWHKIK